MKANRDLTTGEAAKLIHLSQQHVIKMCAEGLLRYYLVPSSRFRRIRIDWLYKFCVDNRLPISKELQDAYATFSKQVEEQRDEGATQES